ncbi:hypothetical protein [Thetidibacter halocola]|uniref:Uncharacterized protein n=1 Tax=Thetidibacter halocola TaxID=2827239 RepID=A0A8J8B908_9RHOB|nr:hypothetical protein [Thetidibacter halocola]MBS0123693.1 hypothetical protein [Thetidibacter halocola]
MAGHDITDLRAGFAGCELVVLADLSTGTVLAADSAIKLGQEHFDRECALAAAVFGLSCGPSILSARLVRPTGLRVFARAGAETPEILCGVFAPGGDAAGFTEAARRFAAAALPGAAGA